MKNDMMIRIGLAASAAITAAAIFADEVAEVEEAEDKVFSAEAVVDVMSGYMWRGQMLSDAPVWQPAVTATADLGEFGSVSANVWASYRLTNRRDGNPVKNMGNHEVDYTVTYAKSFGPVDLSLAHLWYTFPNNYNTGNAEEICFSATYNNEIVTPTASVFWDYRDNEDDALFYASLALAREFELMEKLTLTPSVSLGLGTEDYIRVYAPDVSRAGFLDQTVGLALGYAVTDWMSLGAQVNYTWIVDPDSRRGGYMGYGENQRVWGGVSLKVAF